MFFRNVNRQILSLKNYETVGRAGLIELSDAAPIMQVPAVRSEVQKWLGVIHTHTHTYSILRTRQFPITTMGNK